MRVFGKRAVVNLFRNFRGGVDVTFEPVEYHSLALQRFKHILFAEIACNRVEELLYFGVALIHIFYCRFLRRGKLAAVRNGIKHTLRALAHSVYERGNTARHIARYGQALYRALGHLALYGDVGKHPRPVARRCGDSRLCEVRVEVVHYRVEFVEGVGGVGYHIRLHTVHIYPAERQHRAEGEGRYAQRNHRRKPAAEAWRAVLFLLSLFGLHL